MGSNPGLGDISALLIQAGDLMAPNCFSHIVSSFEFTKVASEVELDSNGKKLALYEQVMQKVTDHTKAVATDSDRERYDFNMPGGTSACLGVSSLSTSGVTCGVT